MIKITKILNHGGSCPFQIDASSNDDRMIYGRYRRGRVRVYVGEAGDLSEDAGVDGQLIFSNMIGDEFDGYMTLEEFKNNTKTVLDFSEAGDDSLLCL
jgi:hypothetical protein